MMMDKKKWFVLAWLLCHHSISCAGDGINITAEDLELVRSCVLHHVKDEKNISHKVITTSNSSVAADLYYFEDKNISVIVPSRKAYFLEVRLLAGLRNILGQIGKNTLPLLRPIIPLLREEIDAQKPERVIFSGGGRDGSLALLLAHLIHEQQPQSHTPKVIAFSPSQISDATFISTIERDLGVNNILFFNKRPLVRWGHCNFPGVPIEILPWEDNMIGSSFRNTMVIAACYATWRAQYHIPSIKERQASASSHDYYRESAVGLWVFNAGIRLLMVPYIPSKDTLKKTFENFQHGWDYRRDGISHGVFDSEEDALVRIGKVSLLSQTRNPLVYYILKIMGGY